MTKRKWLLVAVGLLAIALILTLSAEIKSFRHRTAAGK